MGTATIDERMDSPWFTGGTPPDRSLRQRMEALERANDIRIRRSQLKRDVRAGCVPLPQTVSDPPGYAAGMSLYDLLLAQSRWGHVKVMKVLNGLGISPVKTLGGLSARQRRDAVRLLNGSVTKPHYIIVDGQFVERRDHA